MSSTEQSDNNDDIFHSILSQNNLSHSLSLDQWQPKCFGSLSLNDPIKGTSQSQSQPSLLEELNQNSDFFRPFGNSLNPIPNGEWREERGYQQQYDPKPSEYTSYNVKTNFPSRHQPISATSSWGIGEEMSRSSNSLHSDYDNSYTLEYDRPPHRVPSSYPTQTPGLQYRMPDYFQNDWGSGAGYSDEDQQKYSRTLAPAYPSHSHLGQRGVSLPRPKNPPSGYPPSLGRQNGPRMTSNDMKRDPDLEASIVYCTRLILFETPNRCLKSVELANALRDRIGKDGLQRAKSVYGGLLVLLELYPETFFVHRIPKNDMVELIDLSVPYPPFHLQNRASVPDQSYRRIQAPQFMFNSSHFPPLNVESPRPSPQFSVAPIEEKPSEKSQMQMPLQSTDQFILLNDIPETVTGGDLWKEFGGNGVVHKVSLDYQSNKRTGTIYFTSAEAARKAFQLHSTGRWRNNLVYSHNHTAEDFDQPRSGEKEQKNGQSVTRESPNESETRLVTVRGDQLPEFFQDVLTNLRDVTFIPHMKWKRSTIADYLFCQVLTDMLRQHCGSGMPIQVSKLQQQLSESFGGCIGLAPLKAMLVAYPEYFEVDADVNIVRPIKPELPSLDGLDDGLTSVLS